MTVTGLKPSITSMSVRIKPLTELLLEAAVRLWVSYGGADKDLGRRTSQDLGQKSHQASQDVDIRKLNSVISTSQFS